MPTKSYHTVVIALGSNVNQEANIAKARMLIRAAFKDVSFSEQMWTVPIGLEGGDFFLNMVAVAQTTNSQTQVEAALKSMERRCGRKRGDSNLGIIALDLDLLRYDDEICHPADWDREYIKRLLKEMSE